MDARAVWLTPYLALQTHYDSLVQQALTAAASSAAREIQRLQGKGGIGAAVRRAQLTQAEAALHIVLQDLFRKVGATVQAGQQAAAAQALLAGWNWDGTLLNNVYRTRRERDAARRALLAAAPKNVEAMILHMRGGGLPLSAQVHKSESLALGWVRDAVNVAIGRGANARELARDVRNFIRPEVPGGVSYAAMRLARTEINAAYHAVAVNDASGKPWVRQMQWNLSRSHPAPDICNRYAAQTWPVEKVPDKPHPQCFCYVTAILATESQFLAAWRRGEYDVYLASHYERAA